MTMKRPIALLGGTFDPLHNGHLIIARHALDDLECQCVQFIPNQAPPHRQAPIARPDQRLTMARIATTHDPRFIVNDIEFERTEPSYMIDTLRVIRARIPDQPLCLLVGEDAFVHFDQWLHWREIPTLSHIVVINRPDVPMPMQPWMKDLLKDYETNDHLDLHRQPAGKIYCHSVQAIHISATDVRKRIAEGEDVSEQLPIEVWRYIQAKKLYRRG